MSDIIHDLLAEPSEPDCWYARELASGALGYWAKASQEKDGRTLFVASTATPDRAGDVVVQDWRLANYRRNPVILDSHNPSLVVGRAVSAKVRERKQLEIMVQWDDSELNPVGMLIAHQHREGYRQAGSVGFRPGRAVRRSQLPKEDSYYLETGYGRVLSRNELLEFSSVSVPMNAEALQTQGLQLVADDPAEAVRREVEAYLPARLRALIVSAIQTDSDVKRAILGAALSVPSQPADWFKSKYGG